MCNCNGKGFISGIVLGGLIGAALGILYAPDKGEKTRKLLKEKSVEMKEKGLKAALELKEKGGEKFEEISDRAQEGISDIKKKARRAMKEITN